uniref:Uncharacterized protein n=1 Tax=Fibrocapsa japonica TaxID=94617 RepID=A0A7S2XZE2_9STRA|mmetsp:Transcript_56/g.97  ORF Transcript_56/g.97 Transcript_56/m.97 type:complete len:200 (+) Transcript_56:1-600(+)
MSYKFYLEMVRAGLYAEFWEQEAKHGLVAFMDPTVYGRSPLEASSFLASSALPDETLHGTGFVSRLSGSTAEFLSLFLEVFVGHEGPFRLKPTDGKTLQFVLQPALPAWMFTPTTDLGGSEFDAILTFTLLGKIPVTYHNPNLVNTWSDGVMVRKMTYHLQEANTMKEFTVEIMSSVAEGYNAQLVRSGLVKKIDVYLA